MLCEVWHLAAFQILSPYMNQIVDSDPLAQSHFAISIKSSLRELINQNHFSFFFLNNFARHTSNNLFLVIVIHVLNLKLAAVVVLLSGFHSPIHSHIHIYPSNL